MNIKLCLLYVPYDSKQMNTLIYVIYISHIHIRGMPSGSFPGDLDLWNRGGHVQYPSAMRAHSILSSYKDLVHCQHPINISLLIILKVWMKRCRSSPLTRSGLGSLHHRSGSLVDFFWKWSDPGMFTCSMTSTFWPSVCLYPKWKKLLAAMPSHHPIIQPTCGGTPT